MARTGKRALDLLATWWDNDLGYPLENSCLLKMSGSCRGLICGAKR